MALWFFVSFLTDLLRPYINKLDSLRYLIIFISSNILVWNYECCCHWLKKKLSIPASDATVANRNGIKMLVGSNLSTFFINGNPFLSNSIRNLLRRSPDCTNLDC